MNTKFFFTLPVIAMFAMTMTTTVDNAKGCKDEVNKVVRVEATSVNNVDAKAYAKIVVLRDKAGDEIARLRGVRDNVDGKIDTKLAKRAGGYNESTVFGIRRAVRSETDAKIDTRLAKFSIKASPRFFQSLI